MNKLTIANCLPTTQFSVAADTEAMSSKDASLHISSAKQSAIRMVFAVPMNAFKNTEMYDHLLSFKNSPAGQAFLTEASFAGSASDPVKK